MAEDEVLFQVARGVARVTINRPASRNALSARTIAELGGALDRAEADHQVRVVCITGAGDRSFCAGADLASMGGGDPVDAMRAYAGLLKRMNRFSRPLVARVAGHCMGGGMGLLLSCDMAYARESVRVGTPELDVGLFPMMIGALIFRNVGRKKGLEMIFRAQKLTASRAEEIGLITRCIPDDTFDEEVDEALADVAAKAPAAASIGRLALAEVADMGLDEALDLLCQRLGQVLATEDATEGLMAFMQKRKPRWKGR